MLASHSRIAIPSETWYLTALIESFPCDRLLQENEVSAAIAVMTNHYTWPDMGLDAAEVRCRAAEVERGALARSGGDCLSIAYGG